jgi:hypothetical protein
MNNAPGDPSEAEKLEYIEGSKVCMHYEVLRRQGLTFFWVVNAAFILVLFRETGAQNIYLRLILPVLGSFISLATLNNDIRLIGYYWVYIERLREIESKYGMSLYTQGQLGVDKNTRSLPNSFFFRVIPGLAILLWAIYLMSSIARIT